MAACRGTLPYTNRRTSIKQRSHPRCWVSIQNHSRIAKFRQQSTQRVDKQAEIPVSHATGCAPCLFVRRMRVAALQAGHCLCSSITRAALPGLREVRAGRRNRVLVGLSGKRGCSGRPGPAWHRRIPGRSGCSACPVCASCYQKRSTLAPIAQLKNSFALSNQPLSVGLCFCPPFLSDSSSSFMSLRWCSLSLTGVSTRM